MRICAVHSLYAAPRIHEQQRGDADSASPHHHRDGIGEVCLRAREHHLCASQRRDSAHKQQTRCGARTKAAPLDPDVPHECAKLVLNPQGSQRRASRRPPPFPAQVALRAFAADEKPREVARLIGEVLAVLSHHVAVSRPRGACRLARNSRNRTSSEKKSEARRSVAASLVQAIWGRGRNARATHCTFWSSRSHLAHY